MKFKRHKVSDIISIQQVNTKINGYYSLDISNKKSVPSLPKIEWNEPLIFKINTYNISFGERYKKRFDLSTKKIVFIDT